MKLRRILAGSLCAACLLTTPPAQAAGKQRYVDVAGDEWFASAALEMTERGVIAGVSENEFGPHVPTTRAMVVTVLWRLFGAPRTSTDKPFSDAKGTWYEAAAAWAKAVGLADGYEDGTFGGEDRITREQLAVFLYRYAGLSGQPIASGALGLFADADRISDWAVDAVRHTVGAGLLQGSEGHFFPQNTADRATLAVTLQRMLTPAAG